MHNIDKKENYRIGEASRILGLEQHVIRFWSNTFAEYIKPKRGEGDRRYYTQVDIETLLLIKDLVYSKKYSLAGVKIVLDNHEERDISSKDSVEFTNKIVNIQTKISDLKIKINGNLF